jgi:hypothetical protein
MPSDGLTLRRRIAGSFAFCGFLLMLCGLYMMFVRGGTPVDVELLAKGGEPLPTHFHYALAMNPMQPDLWARYYEVAPQHLQVLIDPIAFQMRLIDFSMLRVSYFFAGFFSFLFGGLFLYYGLFVVKLFYAQKESNGRDVRSPLDFLLRVQAQKYQKKARDLVFIPERKVWVALLFFALYGCAAIILYWQEWDGLRSGVFVKVLYDYSVMSGFEPLLNATYDPMYLSFMWQVVSFFIAVGIFLFMQSFAQFEERRVLFLSILIALFLAMLGWVIFSLDSLSFEYLGGQKRVYRIMVVLGLLAGLGMVERFGRGIFRLRGDQQFYAVAGLASILVMAVLFVMSGSIPVYFWWSGLALTGFVSGCLYRPRQKNYKFYQ